MEYKDLYRAAEKYAATNVAAGRSAFVPVVALKAELVNSINWLDDINIFGVDAQEGDPLGHYELYSQTESRWDDPETWVVLVTYKKDLNAFEQRFVWCKELMHIFDTQEGCVETEEEYRQLLMEIELKPIDSSEKYLSENRAKWMALLIMCPKIYRDEIKIKFDEGEMDEHGVAQYFQIPHQIVGSLMSVYYDNCFDQFL